MKLVLMLLIVATSIAGSSGYTVIPAQDEEVEGIYMRTVTRYGLSGVYVKNAIYLLLKDGTIYKNLSVPLDELNVVASRQEETKHWGTWDKQGDVLNVTWSNGKSYEWKKWFVTDPAQAGERLSGVFKSSDPFTGATAFNVNTLVLTEEGDYYWLNQKGGQTSWRSLISESEMKGRYELDGHKIVFHDESGESESHLFYFYPGKRDVFGIGKSDFLPVKEEG